MKQNYFTENIALIIILAVAAFLRFYHIDFQSVWLDEIHTLTVAKPAQSIPELFRGLNTTDPHPPLYFLLAYLCFSIFGYTTLVLKMLSAVLGVAGVYALYVLGKELFSKNTGLLAAGLAAINYFQIYYSQEGRMYSLLFLTTTISFIYLVRYLRNPGLKTALWFGLFSTVMIYSHLFGVFTLIAQYAIILFFTIRPYKATGKKIFLYSIMTGSMTFILYIPVLLIIMKNTGRSSIWIELPHPDFMVQCFREFFGWSKIQTYGAVIFMLLYLGRLFSQKRSVSAWRINPETDKVVFSFLLFSCWIVITVLTPYVLSYMVLPMMVNRYFINILPAILLMMAAGLNFIRIDKLRYLVLLAFLFFTLQGLFLKRDYYNTYTKSQFREVSQFILDKDKGHDPVISNLGWYYRYFFEGNTQVTVEEKTLQAYVDAMMKNPSAKRSFWYADAHGGTFTLDEKGRQFLDENFHVVDSADLLDAWTKHYKLK